jgi:hypothetical protein
MWFTSLSCFYSVTHTVTAARFRIFIGYKTMVAYEIDGEGAELQNKILLPAFIDVLTSF